MSQWRQNLHPEKEHKWLEIAEHIGKNFSTCVRRQYGAVIIGKDGRVVSIGYNGAPHGLKHCSDGGCPRAQTNVPHGSVYDNCIAVHAEANALLYSDINLRKESILVVNGPPCYGCAKLIAGSGVKRVVCYTDSAYSDIDKIIDLFTNSTIEFVMLERNTNG